jgi:hypothetical protein
MTKMMKGQGVNVPVSQMGSDKGDVVIMLHPQNARKMLTAYRKNKGMRLAMSPAEMEATMTHGRGFNIGKAFKKMGSDIKKGFTKTIINPAKKTFTPALGRDIVSGLEKAGKTTASALIHAGIPAVAGVAGDFLGGPLGGVAGAVAGDMLADQVGKATGYGLYGGAMPDPATARKHYMHMIRSMRGMSEAEKQKIRGSGLFKMLHKIGISKKSVIKGIKDVGKKVVRHGAQALGTAIGAYTGNPVAGAMLGDALGRAGEVGLDSLQPAKHGIKFDRGEAVSSLKKDMKDLGKVELQRLVAEKVPAEYQGVAQQVLAGVPIRDIVDEELHHRQTGLGVVKRGRGRPKKVVGQGASQSTAYKKALSANFSGLVLSGADGSNAPVSQFSTNPNVRVSSDEMTLSPYQSTTAPAMNPFIPTYYTQMGGTQSGYGGRGLYGGGLY